MEVRFVGNDFMLKWWIWVLWWFGCVFFFCIFVVVVDGREGDYLFWVVVFLVFRLFLVLNMLMVYVVGF